MNLPNFITLGRLLLVPVAVWLILEGDYLAAFATFVVAGVSDGVDGFIARRFGQRTKIGALFDPLADKTLLVSVYVTLGAAGQLPTWLVILVVFRDLLIVGGFLFGHLLGYGGRWEPLAVSKLNTAFQIVLAAATLGRLGFGLGDYGILHGFIYVVGATTILSGSAYLVRWTRILAGVAEVE